MDTIVAPITPLIISSIIVIRISGPDALMALKFIRGKRKLLLIEFIMEISLIKTMMFMIVFCIITLKLLNHIQAKKFLKYLFMAIL